MIFTHKKWATFCAKLAARGFVSIPACQVTADLGNYLVLKHDVETDVAKALQIAEIEHQYGHCGSYYVQAYLLSDPKNIQMLQKMQKMGHEISYHYDVMDSCKGDLNLASKSGLPVTKGTFIRERSFFTTVPLNISLASR